MLWHDLIPNGIPRDPVDNVCYRHDLRKWADENYPRQQALKLACSEDIFFYINTFIWQYNPRKKGKEVGPFITWPFQEEAIQDILRCVETDEDLVAEKSREMGATWLFLIVMEWLWHFQPWKKFLCISRNEKAVEAEDPDSLFWKIDFIHRYLPVYLRPKMKRLKLYYGNEDNGSTITGQASTGKAGVGGRATAMFIDEFSQIEEDYEVLHRTSDTTGCRLFNGTHLGLDTAFYELTQRVDMKKLRMHWTQHPDKNAGLYHYETQSNKVEVLDKSHNFGPDYRFIMDGSPTGGPLPGVRSPWYDKECRRKGSSRAIAMDLDIDPKGSVSQVFDRLLIRVLQEECVAPYWEGDVHFDSDTGRGKLVQLPGGPLKLWINLSGGAPPRGIYAFGADVSAGTGATPSCLSGVKVSTGEKILEYSNAHILADKFAALTVALCWLFKSPDDEGALLCWEMAGPGAVFGTRVVELGYRHVYYKRDEYRIFAEVTDKPGWQPTTQSKRLWLEEYQAALRDRAFRNPSKEALEQCLWFRYDKRGNVEQGKESPDPSGAGLNHADMAMADAQSCKMMRLLGVPRKEKEEPVVPQMSLQWRRDFWHKKEQEEWV